MVLTGPDEKLSVPPRRFTLALKKSASLGSVYEPPLTVRVPPANMVQAAPMVALLPSSVTSTRLSVVRTGTLMVPPLRTWREELLFVSEPSLGNRDRSTTLLAPSASTATAPPGLPVTALRSIRPPPWAWTLRVL